MSLNAIMNTASSGLHTAQTQLRVVSDNVSNVNTPGYVRKVAEQRTLTSQGMGAGVEVARIRLATDRFLQAASLNAGAESARMGVRHELFDRIQSLFGDPGGDSGFFSQVDSVFSAFAASAEDPTSSPRRQDALFRTQALFDEAGRVAQQLQAVREDADSRIHSAVERTNALLQEIEGLNLEIARATAVDGDASGAETAQAALIGQLAELLDIRVTTRSVGGVSIRTGSGALLAGQGAATVGYNPAGTITGETAFNEIWITEPGGPKRSLLDSITSGEIKGLVELRDIEAPAAAERLAELVAHVADELNRAHNANSAVPAPTSLTGRNVGQTFEAAIAGFSGQSTIAVTNSAGVIQTRADIVFSGGTMTVNGAAATPATFLTILNAQLGGAATASFVDGRLSIAATGTNGVAVVDDAANPSNKAGRGFSHYFGLNDLISTDRPAFYDNGLAATSPHGFTAGETLTFRFTGETGSRLRDLQVAVPAGGTVGDLVAALNDPATSGVSVTELFGIAGGVRSSRADGFSVRADIRQSPSRLALAQVNLAAAPGTQSISTGDGRGALALADAGERTANFQAAGGASGGATSVSRYAAELSGEIGGKAAAAKNRMETAEALYSEASARQTAHEGVNLDEELVLMTTYQQAFNASARLIQAAKDMYDTLMGMV